MLLERTLGVTGGPRSSALCTLREPHEAALTLQESRSVPCPLRGVANLK